MDISLPPFFHGFMGYDFFAHHVVCFDFPHKQLLVQRPCTDTHPASFAMLAPSPANAVFNGHKRTIKSQKRRLQSRHSGPVGKPPLYYMPAQNPLQLWD
jgi:hypothetical protein